jgi:hypothetical protein
VTEDIPPNSWAPMAITSSLAPVSPIALARTCAGGTSAPR